MLLLFEKLPSVSELGSLHDSLEGRWNATPVSSEDNAIESMSEGSHGLERSSWRYSESSSRSSGRQSIVASTYSDRVSRRSHEGNSQRKSSQRVSTIGSAASGRFRSPAVVPFLTWKLSWGSDARTDVERDQNVLQLLNRVHDSIVSRRLVRLYLETTRCTAESALRRLQALTASIGRSA